MKTERVVVNADLSVDKPVIEIKSADSASWRPGTGEVTWLFFFDLENGEPAPFGKGAVRIGSREEVELKPSNFAPGVKREYRYCISSGDSTICASRPDLAPPPTIIIDDETVGDGGA